MLIQRYKTDEYFLAVVECTSQMDKTTCRVLRYGGSQAELTRRRALAAYNSSSSEVAKQQITYALAINQYCPEFANS